MDSELEELKKIRMNQLRQTYSEQLQNLFGEKGLSKNEQQRAEAEAANQLEAVEEVVKAHLTKEALQRYGTLKLAHPETATRLLIAIAQAIETGRFRGLIGEEQLVSALKQLSKLSQQQQHRKIKVVRK